MVGFEETAKLVLLMVTSGNVVERQAVLIRHKWKQL